MLISNGQVIPLQALSETVPMVAASYWYPNEGLQLVDRWATYSYLYRSQPVLAGVIDKASDLVARLPLRVLDTSTPDAATIDTTSDYAKLLQSPCSFMGAYQFKFWWSATREIYGEAFALKVRTDGIWSFDNPASGAVVSLAPMHPTRTQIRRDQDGEEWFIFTLGTASQGLLTVPRSEVVVERLYSPETTMRGLSRLDALTRTIQNEDAIRTAMSSTWQRGATPSIALTMNGSMNPAKMEEFQAKLSQRHSGPSKSGGIMLLPTGVTPTVLQIDPTKMQLIDSLKLTREEICIRMDFPPPAVHILDHATFSNITEQMRSMYRDSMAPRLEAFESVLDFDLRYEFFTDNTHRAQFNLDEVLRGDFETRAKSGQDMVGTGVLTPNEARIMIGFPRSKDPLADQLYANSAIQPLGQQPTKQLPPAPAAEPAPPEKPPTLPPATRAVSGRLGRAITKASTRDERHDAYRDEFHKAMEGILAEQKSAALALVSTKDSSSAFQVGEWDQPLSDALAATALAVALQSGRTVDPSFRPTQAFQDQATERTKAAAHGINAVTMKHVNDMFDEEDAGDGLQSADPESKVDSLFTARNVLLLLTAVTLATTWANAGEFSSAARSGQTVKTWRAGSAARPAHAAMDGESVAVFDTFSDGSQFPADGSQPPDLSCGCNCTVDFDKEDTPPGTPNSGDEWLG